MRISRRTLWLMPGKGLFFDAPHHRVFKWVVDISKLKVFYFFFSGKENDVYIKLRRFFVDTVQDWCSIKSVFSRESVQSGVV